MEIKQCILTNNDCYKTGRKITPKGIVVHSTGANNPYLKRYVQPDDGLLGVNKNNNSWNKSGLVVCVHAFIGKDKNDDVRCYQTLPFNYACWGVGSGRNGSYNYNPAYIQFEICEDALTDKNYFTKAFDVASDFCAYLCKEYNISIDNVVSHQEAYKRGYGSNHADCDHWLKKFGKTMNDFRNDVKAKLGNPTPETKVEEKTESTNYLVKVTADVLNVRDGAGTNYKINTTVKKNEIFTIVETKDNWGKLKSGAGWICLDYTERYSTGEPTYKTHIVKKGETLSGIAKKYNTTYQKIAKDNNISDPNKISVGQKLIIK